MRQENKVLTFAKYSELDENQKQKVLSKLYDLNTDYDWFDNVIEDAKNLLGKLGFSNIDIQFSGFCSQGDGASFTGTFQVPKTVKELNERIRAFKQDAPKDKLYNFSSLRFSRDEKESETLEVYRISRHYSHENTVSVDHDDLKEFVRSFSGGLYESLKSEYDYLTSREAIEETIDANDYEFDLETLNIA